MPVSAMVEFKGGIRLLGLSSLRTLADPGVPNSGWQPRPSR